MCQARFTKVNFEAREMRCDGSVATDQRPLWSFKEGRLLDLFRKRGLGEVFAEFDSTTKDDEPRTQKTSQDTVPYKRCFCINAKLTTEPSDVEHLYVLNL